VSTKVAAHDLGAAVDYILRKRKVAKINVMGWSWGTSIAGSYTSEHNDKVNRLVLYAPHGSAASRRRPRPPMHRRWGLPARLQGLGQGALAEDVPADKQADLIGPAVFEAWPTRPGDRSESSKQNPPMLRAPNGVAEDSMNLLERGQGVVRSRQDYVPTLLLHAEWDADLSELPRARLFRGS